MARLGSPTLPCLGWAAASRGQRSTKGVGGTEKLGCARELLQTLQGSHQGAPGRDPVTSKASPRARARPSTGADFGLCTGLQDTGNAAGKHGKPNQNADFRGMCVGTIRNRPEWGHPKDDMDQNGPVGP